MNRPKLRFLPVLLYAPAILAQSYLTTTVAGTSRLLDGDPATSVPLRRPWGIAQDSAGNFYFADSSDNRVRRVDVKGTISTVAGNGVAGFSGDGGPATAAELDTPQGVALDSNGNLYIADYYNERVRKVVLSTGVIATVAGNGNYQYSGDGAAATAAGVDPFDVAVDSTGNLYIADNYNSRIRKVTASTQNISSLAGSKTFGNSGNGTATGSVLDGPQGISVDANANVYFVDFYNNQVKMINQAANKIAVVAGSGNYGYGEPQLDGDGGPALAANLLYPYSTSIEPDGNLLILSWFELWRVTSDGNIHFLAGSDTLGFSGDGGAASSATFAVPVFVTAAPNDDILLADLGNYRVRRIRSNIINTVAGTAIADNIPATSAFLNSPEGILPNGKGGLFIADTGDSRIREVSSGTIQAFYGTGVRGSNPGQMYFPEGMAQDPQGNLYFTDTGNNRVLRLLFGATTPSVFAGTGTAGFAGDGGYAPNAELNGPTGVAADANGNIYIAEAGNLRIRVVNSNQQISTYAGTGGAGFSGDGGPAKNAKIAPNDVVVYNGSLYVADTGNNRVRKIDLSSGVITTVAGVGTPGYSGDGATATTAQLDTPLSIALDAAGNLYIADWNNSVIRKVTNGVISTVAGVPGQFAFSAETGTALGVPIDPQRIVVDGSGNIYFADSFNDRVRQLTVQMPSAFSISSGNAQSGAPGTSLTLAIEVTDANGNPVGGVTVNFTVTSGSATLSAPSAVTSGDGVASVQVTLGSMPGPVTIAAAATGLTPATFNLTVTPPATPVPQITVLEGSGFSTPPVLGLSTGAIATVKGTNFGGPATFVSVGAGDLVNGNVPVNFQGICVTVGGTRAPIDGASATQVNFQAPVLSGTSTSVVVIAGCDGPNPLQSAPATIAVQAETPEFFYFQNNSNGQNPVAATDSLSGALLASPALFPGSGIVAAQPGEYVTIYGTGFGPTSPAVAPGTFFAQLAPVSAAVTVTLGGTTLPAANVQYAGLTPNSPGLYQLNILLPADTPSGDLPLVITVGGASSSAGAYLTVQ
ncbi:MAG TPA: Ig-like domain-containing protein [Bryobacteraceae bacterium]|nr:Ig-like domain-containing protein [Bryobacteraceae bacterium]